MQGFLQFLDRNIPSGARGLNRIQAVVEHYFTSVIFPDVPKSTGEEYASNLMDFIRQALLTDAENREEEWRKKWYEHCEDPHGDTKANQ